MTQSVAGQLQSHMDTMQTTMCWLLKIVPPKAAAFGVTSLDQDVDYDDGGGVMTYSSITGLNMSAIETGAGLSVDNAEAMLLISTTLTHEEIEAGQLDYSEFYLYRINWKDTSQGHYLGQSGNTGAIRADDELSGVIELRGLAQALKQNFIDLYSIGCRASFGSQDGDEKFPCMFDETSLWANYTVDTVGTEPDLIFDLTTTPSATGPNGALPFDTALIEFLTGYNAGLIVETEAIVDKDIVLRFAAPFPIEAGDTLKMRPDCGKRYEEDCIDKFANGVWFRGEPYIPLTEEAPAATPFALVGGFAAPIKVVPDT